MPKNQVEKIFIAMSRENSTTGNYDLVFRHGAGSSTSWTSYGDSAGIYSGNVDYLSIDVYAGTPYIAFKDESSGNEATVIYWTGLDWETLGATGFTSGDGVLQDLNIKVKHTNEVYLSYNRQGRSCYVEKWGR